MEREHNNPTRRVRSTAYFDSGIDAFCELSRSEVIGQLTTSSQFDIDLPQGGAWEEQVGILQATLKGLNGHIFLEFKVPRVGSRIDALVVVGPALFPMEFKVGAVAFGRADYNQAWDYALDLKNFHRASHSVDIFPMLVATEAPGNDQEWGVPAPDRVFPPLRVNSQTLRRGIEDGLTLAQGPLIPPAIWCAAPYQPTPTIVQAAQALYSQHSVEEITRSGAGHENLSITAQRIERLVSEARSRRSKIVIFVTGVPGAGKTLIGLNIATQRPELVGDIVAAYLSGNVPLIRVLSEALTLDEMRRLKAQGEPVRVGEIRQKVKSFIQSVHHFRDAGVENTGPPADHVVVFDEAQRAWDQQQTASFMRRRRHIQDFDQSEPEFLLGYMDRRDDWAAVVCLVGGGQEIHTGEAGIAEWLRAVHKRYEHWTVYVSDALAQPEYNAADAIEQLETKCLVRREPDLHLATCVRSFRAAQTSRFVESLLNLDQAEATSLSRSLRDEFPIVLTRNLARAKEWLRGNARGSERYGLVASSSAHRLKPHAIEVRVEVNEVHWFLKGMNDTRSSYFLEDAATEFKVQGLELDWVCVTWDADLRFSNTTWTYNEFRGTKWNRIKATQRQRFLLNSYRVLLTRARQGMVVFVPPGDVADQTRNPAYYNGTYEYLRSLGVATLD